MIAGGLQFSSISGVYDWFTTIRPSDPFGEFLFGFFIFIRGRKDERTYRQRYWSRLLLFGHESIHGSVAQKREQDREYKPKNVGLPPL